MAFLTVVFVGDAIIALTEFEVGSTSSMVLMLLLLWALLISLGISLGPLKTEESLRYAPPRYNMVPLAGCVAAASILITMSFMHVLHALGVCEDHGRSPDWMLALLFARLTVALVQTPDWGTVEGFAAAVTAVGLLFWIAIP